MLIFFGKNLKKINFFAKNLIFLKNLNIFLLLYKYDNIKIINRFKRGIVNDWKSSC